MALVGIAAMAAPRNPRGRPSTTYATTPTTPAARPPREKVSNAVADVAGMNTAPKTRTAGCSRSLEAR
jgi:hypothetical protein